MSTSEQERAREKQRRAARMAAGLCGRCGKRAPREGTQLCEECHAYHRQRFQWEHSQPEWRDKRRDALRKWVANNRAHVNQRQCRQIAKLREETFDHYGRKCNCCGESNPAFLCLDHVNNDGKQHRLALNAPGGGQAVYRDLKRRGWPPIVQTLCWNCNAAKAIYGECPHKSSLPNVS